MCMYKYWILKNDDMQQFVTMSKGGGGKGSSTKEQGFCYQRSISDYFMTLTFEVREVIEII